MEAGHHAPNTSRAEGPKLTLQLTGKVSKTATVADPLRSSLFGILEIFQESIEFFLVERRCHPIAIAPLPPISHLQEHSISKRDKGLLIFSEKARRDLHRS